MNTWRIGSVTITRVVESEGPTRGTFLFQAATPEKILRHTWLQPYFANAEGYFISAVQAYLIESEGRRIIVDTCVGNDKPRSVRFWNMLQTSFLDDLAAAGFPRESIDLALCTHLHVDHVGWNTMLVGGRWTPTFPKARYLFARREWEFWQQQQTHPEGDVIGDSVRPVIEAGLCDLVEMDHRLTAEVWLEPTPGHTPGHVSVRISSQGENAVITGDLMHHPAQCAEPDWASNYDADPAEASATRRAFLARYADQPTLVLGTHFATPAAGHIVSDGHVWRLAV
jgi:glyoxylase-like metal-dependent hydrolase (beta-lactamase superfamily II)